MADVKKSIIIDFKFDVSGFKKDALEASKEVERLTAKQKELEKSVGKSSLAYIENSAELKRQKDIYRENENAIKNVAAANNSNTDSNKALKAALSANTLEYNKLSESERTNSTRGKELFANINQVTATLKENEKAVGDNRREVGNYALILSELKAELKAAKGEAFAMGQQYGVASLEFQEASKRAGELADKIKETNEATKVFTTGSNFEQFGNQLKGVGDDLASLDFEGASEKAQQLVTMSKKMTFTEAMNGIKGMGSTLMNLGKALLANPLFLLASVIIGVAMAAKEMYDSFERGNEQLEESRKAFDDFTVSALSLKAKLRDIRLNNKEDAGLISKEAADRVRIQNKLNDDLIELDKERYARQDELAKKSDMSKEQRAIARDLLNKEFLVKEEFLRATAAAETRNLEINIEKDKNEKLAQLNEERQKTQKAAHQERLKQIEEERKEQERLFQEVIKREVDAQQQLDEIAIKNIKDKRERELAELDASFEAKQSAIVGDGEKQKELELQLLAEQTKAKNELLQQYKNEDDEKKAVERQMELELQEILAENELASLIELEKAKADAKILEIQRVAAINQSSEIETALLIAKVEKEKTNNIKGYEKQLTDIKKAENKARLESTMIVLEAVHSLALGSTKAAKGVALAQLAISTGKSISSIVEMATAAGSAAGSAAAVVTAGIGAAPAFTAMKTLTYLTALGQIMGNFAQAKSIINQGKAAKGGIFGGESHANGGTKGYFDDGTQIEVEKGELFAVVNKRNTSMLRYLNDLNTFGGNGNSFFERGGVKTFAGGGIGFSGVANSVEQSQGTVAQMVEIIQNLPNPVVVVQDINQVQSDVNQVEVIATI